MQARFLLNHMPAPGTKRTRICGKKSLACVCLYYIGDGLMFMHTMCMYVKLVIVNGFSRFCVCQHKKMNSFGCFRITSLRTRSRFPTYTGLIGRHHRRRQNTARCEALKEHSGKSIQERAHYKCSRYRTCTDHSQHKQRHTSQGRVL